MISTTELIYTTGPASLTLTMWFRPERHIICRVMWVLAIFSDVFAEHVFFHIHSCFSPIVTCRLCTKPIWNGSREQVGCLLVHLTWRKPKRQERSSVTGNTVSIPASSNSLPRQLICHMLLHKQMRGSWTRYRQQHISFQVILIIIMIIIIIVWVSKISLDYVHPLFTESIYCCLGER